MRGKRVASSALEDDCEKQTPSASILFLRTNLLGVTGGEAL